MSKFGKVIWWLTTSGVLVVFTGGMLFAGDGTGQLAVKILFGLSFLVWIFKNWMIRIHS